MSENGSSPIFDFVSDALGKLTNLFTAHQRDLLLILRQPTPQKIVVNLQANAAGVIGGGFANPQPVTLWQCPMSHEAWINRISVTVPGSGPGTPLGAGQGQAYCTGQMGEPIFMMPIAGTVAPLQITEGRLSAAHLNSGEQIVFYGDSFPANQKFRIDFQIVLTTGVSPDTPWMRERYKVLD